ncbi:hypothetical protein ACFSO7_18150 [Bacillus sp. CGMCC 1.16607]|uniref:hypothetical protein n=1 Tax=Bacillus sp. CGMCC 1.16607 TaxID=3351842 RepID=UPI0036303CF0
MKNILFFLIAIISCYLFESWVSVPKPFSLTAVILLVVFNPIKIFAAACAFFIGFINGGVFIRNRIIMIKRIINRKDRIIPELIYFTLFISTFYFLSKLGFWQTTLFFSFALLYGMMTIEKNI